MSITCSNNGSSGTHYCLLFTWVVAATKFVLMPYFSDVPTQTLSTEHTCVLCSGPPPRSGTGDTGALFPNTWGLSKCWLSMRLFVFLHLSLSCCLRTRHLGSPHYLMNSQANSRSASSFSRRSSAAKSSLAGDTTRQLCMFVAVNVRQGRVQFNFCSVHMRVLCRFQFKNLKQMSRKQPDEFKFILSPCLLFCIFSFLLKKLMTSCISENNPVVSWAVDHSYAQSSSLSLPLLSCSSLQLYIRCVYRNIPLLCSVLLLLSQHYVKCCLKMPCGVFLETNTLLFTFSVSHQNTLHVSSLGSERIGSR